MWPLGVVIRIYFRAFYWTAQLDQSKLVKIDKRTYDLTTSFVPPFDGGGGGGGDDDGDGDV